MFVLRKWFLAKKKSCKCLKPCQRRKGSAGRRCGCSGCNPGLAGSPSVPLRFQPALRAPQRAGVRTRPGRSSQTHTGRPNRTFFAATSPNVREIQVINGRFQAKSQDDSLFPISQVSASSAWARDSETLLTPDCAAAARAGASYHKLSTSYLQVITSNLQGHVDINLQSTAPSLLGSLCRVTVVPFRPAHQTGETGWVSHQFGSTNVFPDAW